LLSFNCVPFEFILVALTQGELINIWLTILTVYVSCINVIDCEKRKIKHQNKNNDFSSSVDNLSYLK
jgi:hypothetical protein